MNRVKKWLKSIGHTFENDLPYLPYGELDGIRVDSENVCVIRDYCTVGRVIDSYDRYGNETQIMLDVDDEVFI